MCVTSQLAGIQFKSDGSTTSGTFKPSEEKFFLSIASTMPLPECPTTEMRGLNYWYFCLAKFAAQIDNAPVLRGDSPDIFIALAGGDHLQLNADMTFSHFEDLFPSMRGYFVSMGKCTKL